MATELQWQRLRLDLGFAADDIFGLSDADAEALFVEAAESYSGASIVPATRVIYIHRLLMQAAADVDYRQNNTDEKASQRWQHLNAELVRWQKKLDDAVIVLAGSAARFGRTTRKPARIKEHPNDGPWGW